MNTDRELVDRIVARDASAFDVLHARYRDALLRHILRYVRDRHAAEDLAQEAFLRVWTRAEQWNGKGPFQAWLFRIAANQALNHLRSLRRRPQEPLTSCSGPEEEDSPAPGWLMDASATAPDTMAEQAERARLLSQLVDGLPEGKRDVMRLVYDAEMEIQEVSETLGIPPGTVKSRLHHARRRLAKEWKQLEHRDG